MRGWDAQIPGVQLSSRCTINAITDSGIWVVRLRGQGCRDLGCVIERSGVQGAGVTPSTLFLSIHQPPCPGEWLVSRRKELAV